MATRLILIRHGQTAWNLEKRYCGFVDIGLNEQGINQAKCLSTRLAAFGIQKVYSSDRVRAIQTAQIALNDCCLEKNPDLREIHFGVFEGLTYKEIMRKYPEIYIKWVENPYSVVIPEGEDLRDFKTRVINAFTDIASLNPDKTVAVFSHGGVISIFVNDILKTNDFWDKIPHSTSVTVVEYERGQAKISAFNDTSHLWVK